MSIKNKITGSNTVQKRAFDRIHSNINVRFNCGNNDYSGIVTNLSGNGMFINTDRMLFPFHSQFNVVISFGEDFLHVPIKVVRITKLSDSCDGVGVSVMEPSQSYLEMVEQLKTALKGLTRGCSN